MAHKNPVVVSADGKKHETLGDGNTLAPGSIPISAESGNGLSVKSDGLFSTAGGGGGGLASVSHNNSLSGSGTTASPLEVKISNRDGNALALIPNSESTSERGLFVPPIQSLERGTSSGNFSFNNQDNKSAEDACGKMGTGVYWKVTLSLYNAGAGNVAVMPRIWTNDIPCMEDGTLVPYQIVTDYVAAYNNAVPSVAVWLICMGVPTHLMSITDGTIKKLQRSYNGLTNGLDDLYPLAPEGESAHEPQWRRECFYTA